MVARATASDSDINIAKKIEAENDPSKMKYEDPHPLVTFFSRKGISYEDFAKSIKYSPKYFYMVLSRWKSPGKQLAKQIEAKTGMSISYLFSIPLKSEYK